MEKWRWQQRTLAALWRRACQARVSDVSGNAEEGIPSLARMRTLQNVAQQMS